MTVLIYELQRKSHNSNNQPGVDNTKDTLTNVQLLVIWRVDDSYKLYVNTMLIKHDDAITWDEDKLSGLYSMHRALFKDDHSIEETWLLDDESVLTTVSKWGEERHTTEIILSEGTRDDNSMVPLCISSKI
jgi:hypothetical protein